MVEGVHPSGGVVCQVEETEMRVLPGQDEEGVVGCARAWGYASVREVGPLAGVKLVVVKVVYLGVCDNGVGVGGGRVEFG